RLAFLPESQPINAAPNSRPATLVRPDSWVISIPPMVKPDRIGSTVRIDKSGDGVSVYFICTTGLVDQFREIYPESFNYVGNREIHFDLKDKLPKDELKHCIAMAFTHHLNKKKKS
ncbi:MAG: hypothetical protein AAFX96_04300, partial [Pseudomonadota bacterium]